MQVFRGVFGEFVSEDFRHRKQQQKTLVERGRDQDKS